MSPVKGLALRQLGECELTEAGIAGDRAFFLVDENDRLVNSKGLGVLQQIVPTWDDKADSLTLAFPDGTTVAEQVAVDGSLDAQFWGVAVPVRVLDGPWSEAISDFAGRALRLVRAPGPATDRMRSGAATLLGTASLRAIARATGVDEVDGRRFRMNFGVDGLREHEEDEWLGRRVQVGDAVVVPQGNVGRCAVTTQNPETGKPDLDTLKALADYRRDVETTEPLPFGVHAAVAQAGRVRLGDPVSCSEAHESRALHGGLLRARVDVLPDRPVSGLRAAGRRVGRRDHLLRRLDPVHRRRRATELACLGRPALPSRRRAAGGPPSCNPPARSSST